MAQYKSAVITKKGVALMGKIMSGSTKLNFSKICTTDTLRWRNILRMRLYKCI